MKISGIDKDFEDIIYYLDSNGFKPFASCDGVEANHVNQNDVGDAYIAFYCIILNYIKHWKKKKQKCGIIVIMIYLECF